MAEELTTNGKSLVLSEQQPLDQNPAAVYLAGLSKSSQRTMRGALNSIAALVSNGQADALTLDWSKLRFQHTAAIRSKLAGSYAPETARKMLSALRGALKAAWKLEQMSAEDYRRAVELDPIKGETLPAGRNLTPDEIAALFAACASDPTAAGARDAAILAILRLGLRRQEVASLVLEDIDLDGQELKVRGGKGNKDRPVPLMNGAATAVADWLRVRGNEPGPLLYAVNKGGRVIAKGITAQAIYLILNKRAEQAGVKAVTPHDWRRTFIGDILDAGGDLSLAQKLAGHADPNTTARYDRRPEETKRRVVNLLSIPYTGRQDLP